MKTSRQEIFRELTPPAGGAARLRAELAAASASRRPKAWWLGPVAVAAVAAIAVQQFVYAPPMVSDVPDGGLIDDAAFDRLLGRASEPYEFRVMRASMPVAVNQIETTDPRVRLYSLDLAPAEREDPAAETVL